jgi:hypothetical protein
MAMTGLAGEKEDKEAVAKRLEATIAALSAKLGHKDFEVRRKATADLIKVGKSKTNAGKDDLKARQAVVDAMKKLYKHDEPEVSERARKIVLAVNPPPTRPPLGGSMPQLLGRVRVPGTRIR